MMLREFPGVWEAPTRLPPVREMRHHIRAAEGARPVATRPYPRSESPWQEIERQIGDLVDKGYVQPSRSPWSAPLLVVGNKDGSARVCVDYRGLNKVTEKDTYPMPLVDELMDQLGSCRYFTTLDLASGFHQVEVAPEDRAKTAFSTRSGHFEWLVMPFGLCRAPVTSQCLIDHALRPVLRACAVVYANDILVYFRSKAEHERDVRSVLQLFAANGLHCKLKKCAFGRSLV